MREWNGQIDGYRLIAAAVSVILATTAAAADPVADFYQGKQFGLLSGGTGGNYDLYMRLLARYMVRYLPGSPEAIPVNMPGEAAHGAQLHNQRCAARRHCPPMVTSTAPMDQVLGNVKSPNIIYIAPVDREHERRKLLPRNVVSPVLTLADATKREVRFAGEKATPNKYSLSLATACSVRSSKASKASYRAEMNLAVERREADGRSTTNLLRYLLHVRVALQRSTLSSSWARKISRVPGCPAAELARNPDQKVVFEFLSRAVSPGRVDVTKIIMLADRVAGAATSLRPRG